MKRGQFFGNVSSWETRKALVMLHESLVIKISPTHEAAINWDDDIEENTGTHKIKLIIT